MIEAPEATQTTEPDVRFGNFAISPAWHGAMIDGQPVHLTNAEFRLLYCLASNRGRVVTYDHLADYTFGYGEGSRETMKTHIWRIRTKFPSLHIEVVVGVGYRLSVGDLRRAVG